MKYLIMKILLICVLFVVYDVAKAGYSSNCQIEGLKDVDWLLGYTRKEPINDTHRGFIASFKTHNVTGMKVEKPLYLDAVLENGELQLFVTERFKNFEVEIKGSYEQHIGVYISFNCTERSDTLNMKVFVIDINNHLPVFNNDVFEYNFGMKLPAEFELTQLLPISASDVDFTNNKISFALESHNSEYFSLRSNGKTKYPDYYNFYTEIETKKNITESIRAEFTIIAIDGGNPVSKSSAKVIIVVDISTPKSQVHPPIFSKSLYYANYTRGHKFIMPESISLLYGEPNLILQQLDHTQYFEISYDATRKEVQVRAKEPLPDAELEKCYLAIRIEARNEGLNIPGKTNLIINLPHHIDSKEDKIVMQDVCNLSHFYVLPIVICFSVILIIMILNVCVVSIHLKRQKLSMILSNPIIRESKA